MAAVVKKRLILVFTFVAINFGSGCQAPISSSTKTETAIVVASELEEKETSNSIEQVLENFDKVDQSFNRTVLFLAKVIIILLSIAVIYRVIILIASRSSQLIIDNFTNASGAEGMEFVLPGLSQLGRERLVRDMKGVHQRLKEHIYVNELRTYRRPD